VASTQHIVDLLYKNLSGTLSPAEQEELQRWENGSERKRLYVESLGNEDKLAEDLALYHPVVREERSNRIWNEVARQIEFTDEAPVHHIKSRKNWIPYAAAVLLLIAAGTYYWFTPKEKPSVTQNNPVPVQNDVAPGGNKATLTLADGSKIVLDSAQQGTIAKESNTTIIKTAQGKIEYKSGREKVATLTYNTMMTPRGGQYQLTLPDGSQVWLNAESSITYPTAFTTNERKVSITGEAYFEVTHNARQPFRVETGSQIIEVLGTHFNINAYKEEPTINTTLLEGSVKIELKFVHTSLILKPGQQGQLAENKLTLATKPDVEQVMAWKNGAFSFENIPLATALREIARWYDVEVIYSNGIPQMTLGGGMGRDLNLSEVLKVLQGFGIKATLENRKLYISNSSS
jgi:transmembrane sensor